MRAIVAKARTTIVRMSRSSDPLRLRGKNVLRGWWSGVLRWRVRLSGRKGGVVLVYHALDERHGDPGQELVAPHGRGQVREQLAHLNRYYPPVRLSQLRAEGGPRRRRERGPLA